MIEELSRHCAEQR